MYLQFLSLFAPYGVGKCENYAFTLQIILPSQKIGSLHCVTLTRTQPFLCFSNRNPN